MSERQVKRLVRTFRAEGAAGLVSKRRGQPSNHKLDEAFKEQALERLRTRYPGFGPTLAAEYLQQDGFPLSRETLRRWMIEGGLWRAAKPRGKPHPPRPRRPRLGELVQIDGNPHDWFEGLGPRCTLIAFIDDATSRVMAACFTRAETTQDYLNGIQSYAAPTVVRQHSTATGMASLPSTTRKTRNRRSSSAPRTAWASPPSMR